MQLKMTKGFKYKIYSVFVIALYLVVTGICVYHNNTTAAVLSIGTLLLILISMPRRLAKIVIVKKGTIIYEEEMSIDSASKILWYVDTLKNAELSGDDTLILMKLDSTY